MAQKVFFPKKLASEGLRSELLRKRELKLTDFISDKIQFFQSMNMFKWIR